jgi:multiple sugar transport system ATP-binding protein
LAQISLTNVWKIYNEGKKDNQVEAVKNLNLQCADGEFLSLLGPSGCGKTSSLRMVAGLETVSRGEIRIGDRVVNTLHPSQRDIAMVFETYALYQHLNIYENIAFPLRVRNMPKEEIDRRIRRAVEILNIGDLLDRMPSHLSDGQKQRVSIGRAIVREPSAFLMDEPISHLDAMLRSRMRREIKHLQGELGITTVYVTHDQLEATAMADRIAVMNLGELQQVGTPQQIFESPANTFVANFVGEPPMNFVEMDIQTCGDEIHLNIEGLGVRIAQGSTIRALQGLGTPKVTLGIRPMYVKMETRQTEGMAPAQVYFVETLDEFNITSLKIGDIRILAENDPAFCPMIGDVVWIQFPEENLNLFDVRTGRNVVHRN